MKTLVVGLGNPILSDDGVGLRVAAGIREAVKRDDVTVTESELSGLTLLEFFCDYDRVIIIDAIVTPDGIPGTIHKLLPSSLKRSRHVESSHGLNFVESIEMCRMLGLKLPPEIIIFAVEARDITNFSEELTPPVAAVVDECVKKVIGIL
jgi:hydrogenase maturation protease